MLRLFDGQFGPKTAEFCPCRLFYHSKISVELNMHLPLALNLFSTLFSDIPYTSSLVPSTPVYPGSYVTDRQPYNNMAEQRNIVVLGASAAGVPTTHYILKHILPPLKAKDDAVYHVYMIAPSSAMYYRVGSPRVAASTARMSTDRIVLDLSKGFEHYPANDFTFVEALATSLDTTSRTISYCKETTSEEERLSYHALIIATGSRTYHQAFSQSGNLSTTLDAIQDINTKVETAQKIVIVGGGPTGVEFAGEVAEHRNGKPGWFHVIKPNAEITLITSGKRLLPTLRHSIGKAAEAKLIALGVDVTYGTRVTNTSIENGSTKITLQDGKELQADLYVPAHGVQPNSSWLPQELLDEKMYLKTNSQTLRVDTAGPRVYALGDIASYSNNNIQSITDGQPVLYINLKRDLLSFDPRSPDAGPKGNDKIYTPETRENQIVPIGSQGGVGAILGYRLPSFLVWLIKGRDYMVKIYGVPMASGASVSREFTWTEESTN